MAPRDATLETLDLAPLTDVMGVEVRGVDLAAPMSAATFAAVRQALGDHSILLFRAQHALTPERQVAFSRGFGVLESHVLRDFCLPGLPEVFVVSNIVENGRHIGAYGGSKEFHSDLAYMAEPSLGSIFRCLECPEGEGETQFASMFAAYDALPAARRAWLDGAKAVFDYAWDYDRRHPDRPPLSPEQAAKAPPVTHPCVRTHPDTGRRTLFLTPYWVRTFVGMDEAASHDLLTEITDFATQDRFTYTHSWRPGDVVIWDNRSTLHRACPFDETNSRRLMHRTTVRGDRPYLAA